MRKVLSLVLAAVLLVSGMVIAPSVASAATLDKQNVAAEAYYFGGQVSFKDIFGNAQEPNGSNPLVWDDHGVIKEGDASKGSIVLDGTINKGEWGDPVVVVDSTYAANNGGVRWATNMDYETASAENTFYYYLDKAPKKGLSFELYMMWDEDYMYVAAKTSDPDGHMSGNSGSNAWDGDSFQFRLDTKGPNSATNGKDYDSRGASKKAPYDLFLEPWEGTIYNDRHYLVGERVSNFVFTYTANGGGMTEIWDGALRYTPEMNNEYKDQDGNLAPTMEWKEHDVSWYYYQEDGNYDDLPGDEGVWGVSYPKMSGIPTAPKFTTTYEFAIPWSVVEEGYTPSVGSELGVAAALFNAATGGSYNSWLSWGSGVGLDQLRWNPQTVGGSNSLTLSDKPYTTSRCSHPEFAPSSCKDPETCTACGYQRGMVSRHVYGFSDTVIPTPNTSGTITATCTVCGDVQVKTIAAAEADVRYSFMTTDTSITGKGFNAGYTTEWKDGPTDAENNRTGNTIFVDGTIKNSFDNKLFPGEAIMDLYTNGSHVATVDPSVTNADHTGTYFEAENLAPTYAHTMEMYFPKTLDVANDLHDHKYTAGIRTCFGDSSKYGYYGAGLYRVEGKFFFAIGENKYCDGVGYTVEEFKSHALAWVEATEEDLATGKWHQYAVMFDEETGTAMFAWDGVLKVAATDDRMQYHDDDNRITPFWRRYNIGLYVRNVQLGDLGLFSKYATVADAPNPPTPVKYTATIDGVATEYAVGETVKISAPVTKTADDGSLLNFVRWTGDVDVLADATAAEAEFVMPDKDVTLNSEYEAAEPAIEGDVNGDGFVNTEDSNMLKQMLIGKIEVLPAADLDGDGKVTTKDAFKLKKLIAQ